MNKIIIGKAIGRSIRYQVSFHRVRSSAEFRNLWSRLKGDRDYIFCALWLLYKELNIFIHSHLINRLLLLLKLFRESVKRIIIYNRI